MWLGILRFFTWSKFFFTGALGTVIARQVMQVMVVIAAIGVIKAAADYVILKFNSLGTDLAEIQSGADGLAADAGGTVWATWLVEWLEWANYGLPIEEAFAISVIVFGLYGTALVIRTVLTFVPTIG